MIFKTIFKMKYLILLTLGLTMNLGYKSDLLSPMQVTDLSTSSAEPADSLDHPLFDKEEMGYMVWNVMHIYSAYVPENPTFNEQRELIDLITLL